MNVTLAGTGAQEVLRLIQDRRTRCLRAETMEDGCRLALIVEGGAMRGVYSAGSLFALARLGCSEVFDTVYATSSGAVNAAYFVSGGANVGVGAYYEDLSARQFINPWRFWKMI